MASFTEQHAMREGQWRAIRLFVCEERKDAGPRERVIRAEQKRIGKLRLIYATDSESDKITQGRIGMLIDGHVDCALAKLMGAYVALGGNPLDISLFLYPYDDLCPGRGFAYPQGFSYTYSGGESDSDSNLYSFQPSRYGGTRETGSERVAVPMGRYKKWTLKEMYHKRIRIEERIIKLSDLHEQLEQEIEEMTQATAGVGMRTVYDTARFADSLTCAAITYMFDSTFRLPDSSGDGRVSVDNEPDIDALASFPTLSDDIVDVDDNNAC